MLAAHFLISVGTGVWILFEFFRDGKQKWIDKCVDQANGDKDAEDICKDAYGAARWTVLAIFVVAWLIELCEFSMWILREEGRKTDYVGRRRDYCG